MSNISVRVGFDTERTLSGPFTGSYQSIGTPLSENPVIIIFDNRSTAAVTVSVDGINAWKTFAANSALVLDLRANHGYASNYSIDLETQFYVNATGGTGDFSISILYAR